MSLSRLKIPYNKFLLFPLALLTLLVLFTLTEIHGSSVGMFNKVFYGDSFQDSNLILGKPRAIRSDEWLVATPLTAAQVKNDLEHENKNIGLEQEMSILYDAPTNHWSTIFEPQNWGFFVMPFENAFAFKWWFRGFLLALSAYLFIYTVSKGNLFLSVGGAIFMLFTPFIQWWYSTSAIETVTYLLIGLTTLMKLFYYKNIREVVFYTALLTFIGVAFALVLYPPFQIPLVYLGAVLIIGFLLNNKYLITKARLKIYILSLLAFIVSTALIITLYYLDFKEIISTIRNTSYPGTRSFSGGLYNVYQFLGGFFNGLLLKNKPIPNFWGNQSEASGTFLLSLFLLPVLTFFLIRSFISKTRVDYILVGLLLYFVFFSTWFFIGLPEALSQVLLINSVPPNRIIIGFVVVNFILVFYFLSRVKVNLSSDYKIVAFLLAVFAFSLYLFLGFSIRAKFPEFYSNPLIFVAIALFIFILVFSLLLKSKYFLPLLVIFSLGSTLLVNPLYRGLDSLISNNVSRELKDIDAKNNGTWVIYSDLVMEQFLIANGISTLNSVHLYPQEDLWLHFDPDRKDRQIWNRYGYIVFNQENNIDKISFGLNNDDNFFIKINPCSERFNRFEVKYFIFPVEEVNEPCLTKVKSLGFYNRTYSVYERK